MIHQANNLFFGRWPNGDIRILKLTCPPEEWPKLGWGFPGEALLDVRIPADQWAHLVSCLSSSDECEQKDFHRGTL